MNYYLNKEDSLNDILKKAKPFDTIYLAKKTYNEKIKITTSNITIIGQGDETIIQNKDYYNKIHFDNKEYLTVRTYTLMVAADNVILENLIIKNLSTPNSIYGQAVALHVLGDNFKASKIKLFGAQDTLLCGPIPEDLTIRYKDLLPNDELNLKKSHQYFKNCYIEGDVDFIFGCGIALFENCNIHSIGKGYIAAPSHPESYQFGFVFKNCNLTCAEGLQNIVYLARPWRPYGQAAFINCKTDSHIKSEGFHFWSKEREKTCRLSQYNTLNSDNLVNFAKVLTDNEVSLYTLENIFNS